MAPRRDPRWKDQGIRIPHQSIWSEQASLWSGLLPEPGILDGPFQLLHTARSLFIHSWFDCDFLTVAVMVASQSVEAAVRVLYPELGKQSSFQALIKRATVDGPLSDEQVEPAHDLREMRNLLAHPLAHANIDILPTVNLMAFAHEIAELVDDWVFGHLPAEWLHPAWQPPSERPTSLRDRIDRAKSYQPFYSRERDGCLHDRAKATRRAAGIQRRLEDG